MRLKAISILVIIAFAAMATGCSTVKEHKGAATGAGVGAAAGAAMGQIIGKSTTATVIGGLLGALAGGILGYYFYDERKDREETVKTFNYQPSEGDLIRVEKVNASPGKVSPGDRVDLQMNYAILTPSGSADTPITEIREITHNGKTVGNPEVRVTRKDGTYTSGIPLQLPKTADTGEYKVRMTVKTPNSSDSKETAFRVG